MVFKLLTLMYQPPEPPKSQACATGPGVALGGTLRMQPQVAQKSGQNEVGH